MLNENQKVTVKFVENIDGNIKKEETISVNMTNPISQNGSNGNKISEMVTTVLDKELPMLKNNSLLHDLVLYTLMEKVKTVQTVENVLSYIKEKNAKEIDDVHFENGEICIKCSV
jgi:hypothetical protein